MGWQPSCAERSGKLTTSTSFPVLSFSSLALNVGLHCVNLDPKGISHFCHHCNEDVLLGGMCIADIM